MPVRLSPVRSLLLVWVALTSNVSARPAPHHDPWALAIAAAWPELDACAQRASTYGQVHVEVAVDGTWQTAASQSLGAQGPAIERCLREAIAKHYKPDGRPHDHTHVVGAPRALLPAPNVLLPAWRRALTGTAEARAALARLLPADHALTPDTCIRADGYTRVALFWWLPSAGTLVPLMWRPLLARPFGYAVELAMWTRDHELVVLGERGLCLAPLDASQQAALGRELAAAGTCWVGSFEDLLLRPHVAFPTNKRYSDVAVSGDHACALATTGEVTCCGAPTALGSPAAARDLRTLALGAGFACGLDAAGAIRCWGNITLPPSGAFTELTASGDRACARRVTGKLACWGEGSLSLASPPAGMLASPFSSCGIRKDKTAACWRGDGKPIATMFADPVVQLVDSDIAICGVRTDHSLVCDAKYPLDLPLTPPPTSKLVKVAGDRGWFCGVREDDGRIECWGNVWPGAALADTTWHNGYAPPPAAPAQLEGRIVDERGRPIANAEVMLCSEFSPCGTMRHALTRSPGTLASLVPAGAKSFTVVTTDGTGTWRAAPPDRGDIQMVAVAPGRELVERAAWSATQKLGPITRLRPTSTLDVDARCGAAACTGAITLATGDDQLQGSHVERLAPGTYTLRVSADIGKPGEQAGTATVDVPFLAKALRVRVDLHPRGTGKSIAGRVELASGTLDSVEVSARCAADVQRTAHAARDGTFVLEDVGKPPCQIQITSATLDGGPVTVAHLPAANLVLKAHVAHHRHPRPD